jgi:hypothetical protein
LTAVLDPATDVTSRPSQDGAAGAHRREESYDAGPGLREYLAALRRYWWLALLTFLLVLGASIASLYVIDPVYRAEAEVLIRSDDSRQLFPRISGTSAGALGRSPSAELVYVEGDAFQELAAEEAGDDAEVEARGALDSSAPTFVAEAGEPDAARDAAQTWAETYVAARHETDVAQAEALMDLLVATREATEQQLEEARRPIAALDEPIANEDDPIEKSRLINQQLAIQRTLAPELVPLDAELNRLSGQISGLRLDLRVMENPGALAYVSRAAELPEERANGSLTQSVLVGVVAGLVLAAGAVAAAWSLRRR